MSDLTDERLKEISEGRIQQFIQAHVSDAQHAPSGEVEFIAWENEHAAALRELLQARATIASARTELETLATERMKSADRADVLERKNKRLREALVSQAELDADGLLCFCDPDRFRWSVEQGIAIRKHSPRCLVARAALAGTAGQSSLDGGGK
jgi:hypothetical protein